MMSHFPEDVLVLREARDLVANAETLQADGLSSMDIKYMKQQVVNERRSRAGAKERIRRGE